MATFRSARMLSSYLVRAKLHPIKRIVGSHKCKGKRPEICSHVHEISGFSSSVTNETINPLSANSTKWPNTLKQFISKLPTNCLSVFDYFVKLALKGLRLTINLNEREMSFIC